MKTMKATIAFLTLAFLGMMVVLFLQWGSAKAQLNLDQPTLRSTYRVYDFFNNSTTTDPTTGTYVATTTSATSTNQVAQFDTQGRLITGIANIAGASKVQFYFKRGDTNGQSNTGASNFRVQVTPDGLNWFDYVKLIGSDISNTATSSVTITAATSTISVSMDLTKDSFRGIRCIVIEITDGQHSCWASVEFGY